MSSLDRYFLVGEMSRDKLEPIHESIVFLRDNIFSSKELGDWYFDLTSIYGAASNPGSFHGMIQPGVPTPRNLALVNSMITGQLVDIATKPELIGLKIKKPTIYTSADEPEITNVEAVTASGYDAELIERLQREWWANPDVTSDILEYRKTLDAAFDEFNLQTVLSNIGKLFHNTSRFSTPAEAKIIYKALDDINTQELSTVVHMLDSAYYSMGKRHLTRAGHINARLQEHEFGSIFALSRDDSVQYIIDQTRKMYDAEE